MSNLTRWQRSDAAVWPTFGRLFGLRDQLDRLFETSLFDVQHSSSLPGGWNPALDVLQDKDNITVKAELPGMKKEEIDVSLENGVLSISGERKRDKKFESSETCREERFVGRFQRSVTLPAAVEAGKVKAQYKDGVLTVTLPKTEEAKPKQINVSVD
jgi:HSP20 family protein